MTGAPRNELIRDILEAVVNKDMEKGIQAIRKATESNADMKIFSRLILEKMRFLFLLRLKSGMDEYIKSRVSEEDFKHLKDLAEKAGKDLTSDTLVHFIEAYEDSGRSSIPELALELALADSINV